LDELADSDYVFVTDEGKPLSYITYMSRWRQACKKAKIIFTPHQARHWYVTMALHKVEDYPPDQKEAFRQGLQAYMHWKSPTTIETYDHHIRIMDHHLIHEMIAKIASEGSTKEKVGSETSVPNPYALTKEHWEFINKRLLGKV
jgi:integrase